MNTQKDLLKRIAAALDVVVKQNNTFDALALIPDIQAELAKPKSAGKKMKIETGVMVMKNGKAWGIEYADGRSTCCGWISPEDAPIHDPAYCRSPTDVLYKGDPNTKELLTAELVHVERRTEVLVVPKPLA